MIKLHRNDYFLYPLFFILLGWVLLRTAWISDDAYITFRSIENFIHGYGPVYNIGERVQTFTHPLWFLILSGINAITQRIGALNPWAQMYYVTLYTSLFFSLAAVLIVLFGIAKSLKAAALSFLILIFSKAFIDYSTSGLENALSYFILALFLAVYLQPGRPSLLRIGLLALLASMSALNRLDTLLLFLPVLVYLIWQTPNRTSALFIIGLSMIPLIFWEIFSLFYYGAPFPNTAYAKLNTGIQTLQLLRQGIFYFVNSLRLDPISLLVIFATSIGFLWKGSRPTKPIVIGILLYLLYIIYIGGDFMSGRYFSLPLYTCAALLATIEYPSNKVYFGLVTSIFLIGLLNPLTPILSSLTYGDGNFYQYVDQHGISDERAIYYPRMGLFSKVTGKPPVGSIYSGLKWRFQPSKKVEVKLFGPLGVAGYQAGPNTHVIDKNALADPLLSRLPLDAGSTWRIGHFSRQIPEGYLETLTAGKNLIQDQNIASFYDKLLIVIRGHLFDKQRVIEIWNLNTGKYNYLIQ